MHRSMPFWVGNTTSGLNLPAVDLDLPSPTESNISEDTILQDMTRSLHNLNPAFVDDDILQDESSETEFTSIVESTVEYRTPTVKDATTELGIEYPTIECEALTEFRFLASEKPLPSITHLSQSAPYCQPRSNTLHYPIPRPTVNHNCLGVL